MKIPDESVALLLNMGKVFDTIERLYFSDNLPLIEGIITKDKYVKIIAQEDEILSNQSDFHLLYQSGFDKNISLLEKDCSYIDTRYKIEYEDYILSCGEGSWGGDGFIVIINLKNNNLKWCMFHSFINPIEKIEIENNKLIGINNLNVSYEFDIYWEKL
jgi:hypothetical protein